MVCQALLVSSELVRAAILWPEMWSEGLEEASRLFYGDHNIDAMFATLEPLHDMLEKVGLLMSPGSGTFISDACHTISTGP